MHHEAVVDWEGIVSERRYLQPFEPPYWQGRAFQLVAREKVIRNKRAILSMPKGSGKTSTALSIGEDPRVNRSRPGFCAIIFTTERGMSAYTRDIKKFPEWEGKLVLVTGSKAERKAIWNSDYRYYVTTYNAFLSDMGVRAQGRAESVPEIIVPKWVTRAGGLDMAIFDEFHRVMRTRKGKFWEYALKWFRHTEYLVPISGSAASKGPSDLWPALHLVDQKFWSSFWKFVGTWHHVYDGVHGKTIGDTRADRMPQFRNAVRPYMEHMTKEQLGDAMPALTRELMPVEIPPWQRKIHDDLLAQSYAVLNPDANLDLDEDPEYLFAENPLVKLYQLRLALICPKALSPALGIGQGIEDIWDDASESELTQYNIFTPFKRPIPYLAEWLTERGAAVWRLQGGIGLDEQERRLSDWQSYISREATPQRPGILLGTVKYGESWECPESSYGYFLGEEWDPEDNKQAESRLCRLISTGPVYIQYCQFLRTYGTELQDLLVNKSANVRAMYKDWRHLKEYLGNHKSQS